MNNKTSFSQESSFNHIIFTGKVEHHFTFRQETVRALSSCADNAQELVERDIIDFISPLPLKSKIIRSFQRFGEDAEYNHNEAGEIFTSSFLTARDFLISQGGLGDESFSETLINEVNKMVKEAYVGDAVSEWAVVYDIKGEVSTLVGDAEKYYGVNLDSNLIVEKTFDACDRVCEEFVVNNDKSNSLSLIAQEGEIQMLIAPHAMSIDDGNNTLKIDSFNETGVGGLRPDDTTLSFVKMAGLTPADIIAELRDEMSPELLSEWSLASKNIENDKFKKLHSGKVDVQDFLDLIEQCGEEGGLPVMVSEINPLFFSKVEAGDDISLSRVGLTMIPHGKNIDLPGVSIVEGPININFNPSQVIPSYSIGVDFLKEASLKTGELTSRAKVLELKKDVDSENNLSI